MGVKRQHFTARLLLAPIGLSAFVATWGGWVGLAQKTGFGEVNLLPGFVKPGEWATVNLGIALPLGVEAYAAYAMSVWFGTGYTVRAKRFAAVSAVFSLLLAAAGQVSYHILQTGQIATAPDWLVGFVSCLPVLVIGMAAALHHLTGESVSDETPAETRPETSWGRLRDAATGAAVTRLNRAAETPRDDSAETQDVPDETPPASQNVPSPSVPPFSETPATAETTLDSRPAVPSQQADETRVPAAQTANVATKPTRDDLVRLVHEMRSETPRVSYAAIAERLNISKAEAGRLGQEATKRFGETTPVLNTRPFPLPSRDAETVSRGVNGSPFPTVQED